MAVDYSNRITKIINSPSQRKDIYNHVRKVIGLWKNGCAATASLVLMRAGVIDRVYKATEDLKDRLIFSGWEKDFNARLLVPGDVCFSADLNRNGKPDHVYIFAGWADYGKVAFVYDNYSTSLTPRNVVKSAMFGGKRYSRTAFKYALHPPEVEDKPEPNVATPVVDPPKPFAQPKPRKPKGTAASGK